MYDRTNNCKHEQMMGENMQALVITRIDGKEIKEVFECIHDVKIEGGAFIFKDESEEEYKITVNGQREVLLR